MTVTKKKDKKMAGYAKAGQKGLRAKFKTDAAYRRHMSKIARGGK